METKTLTSALLTRLFFDVCPRCKGDTFIEISIMIGEEMGDGVTPCPLCHGKGVVISIVKPNKQQNERV